MTISLDLPDEAFARLQAEAVRRGMSADALVAEIAREFSVELPSKRKLSCIGIGASTSGHTAANADKLLAGGFGRS